jgi:acetyltransferase-like isoleucine patch superfamily enzyme
MYWLLKGLDKIFFKLLYILLFARKKGLKVTGKIRIKGVPLIDIRNGGSITIENNVTLNSMNYGYHINMHSPVKLFADRPGAEIIIGENSRINGTCIHAWDKIIIGKNCLTAANTQIFDSNGHDLSFPDIQNRINTTDKAKPIVIGDNVWIGANCLILPGVTIGEGSVIAAGSVVVKDIPAFVVAAGNPARVKKDFSCS